MHNFLMLFGIFLIFIGLPASIITTIVMAVKKKKILIPVIAIPSTLFLGLFVIMIGGYLYGKTDEYKESMAKKESEKQQEIELHEKELELKEQELELQKNENNKNENTEETLIDKTEKNEENTQNSFINNEQELTTGQKNALRSAENYLEFLSFSYTGLIEQLEFEKYSHEDAVYAADNCGADWYEQAAKSAKNYLDFMPFSKEELIEQLEFEGFTHEQAVYGVEQNGY